MSLGWALLAFAVCIAIIGYSGVRLARIADTLADITRLGEAILGAVFVGATTSLSGSVLSITAALEGHASLAASNAVGGIAAQIAFLAIADLAYRKTNLEFAAASQENLMQCALLFLLLCFPLLALFGPAVTWFTFHPVSLFMLPAYWFCMRLVSRAHKKPMWLPRAEQGTVKDVPARQSARPGEMVRLWGLFVLYGLLVGSAGWLLAKSGVVIARETGLSETFVGGLLTAITTSIPELVIAVTAVRQGALTLAVGNIIGGNTFDTLMLAMSDFAYRPGSLYQAMGREEYFLLTLSMLLTSILLLGLLRREKHGIANIGLESFLMLIGYLGGFLLIFFF